jgi:glutaredoxin
MRFRVITPSAACAALILLVAAPAWAQLYRSVGPDGRVTYSDMPPAASARGGERIGNDGGGSGGAATRLPYDLAQVAQKYPVTLYASPDCVPCDSGRSLLIERGIPFTEKTVESNNDIAALKKIAGDATLPLLTIGSQQLSGFQSSNWSQYLSAAGYPQASQLPSGYQRPIATSLAPKPPVAAASAAASAAAKAPVEGAPAVPSPDPSNPAGIRF